MPEIPAVCNKCGSFYPSGYVFNPGETGVTGTVNVPNRPVSRPCPACGGNGHVLGGAWHIVENTIQILEGPERTISELQRLAGILRKARDRGANLEEVRGAVERAFPSWGQGLSKLLVPRTPADLAAYLTLILMIIGMILDAKNADRTVEDEEVNQTINDITVEAPTSSAPPARSPLVP